MDVVGEFRRSALAVLEARILDAKQVLEEYRSVVERDLNITATYTAAQAPGNAPKNRYVNVLPYDHNRVTLGHGSGTGSSCGSGRQHQPAPSAACGTAAPSASSSSDYINASYICHTDPLGFAVRYIACQGPLPATVDAFWQMVGEQGVGAVVMLTNTAERGSTKCCAYFPTQPGARLPLRSSGGEVALTGSEVLHRGDLTHRQLALAPAAGTAPRSVAHLQYHAWPDHGTPAESAALRTMCDLLEPVRGAGGGVVVHCSAGIGRTGTFIALDVLRLRLAALARGAAGAQAPSAEALHAALDLPALVASLRQQRCGMVQTLDQYAFIYQALHEELAGGGPHVRELPPPPPALARPPPQQHQHHHKQANGTGSRS